MNITARPLKEGMDYFPHDVEAVDDEKIDAMRSTYGNDGYSFYFILLERIYRTDNGQLDISNRLLRAAIIRKIGVDAEKFENMLNDAMEIGLFDKKAYESGVLTSRGVQKRFAEINKQREKWRKKRVIPKDNSGDNHSYPRDNMERTSESKVKKSKVKQNIVSKDTTPETSSDKAIKSDAVREVIEFYNQHRRSMSEAKTLSKQRTGFIHARIEQYGIDNVRQVVLNAEKSDFLNGMGNKAFRADLNWIMRPENFPKVLEEKYENRTVAEESSRFEGVIT